jgi:hypothetical protein
MHQEKTTPLMIMFAKDRGSKTFQPIAISWS